MAYTTPFERKDGELYIKRNPYKNNDRQPDYKARGTFDGQPVTIALWKREGKSYDYFCKIEHYTPSEAGATEASGLLAGAAELEAHRRNAPQGATTDFSPLYQNANAADFDPSSDDLPF